jgi:hypothetical protein
MPMACGFPKRFIGRLNAFPKKMIRRLPFLVGRHIPPLIML